MSLTKTADDPEVEAGAADGYTVTVSNPGAVAQTLTSITDTLPAGFTYVAGSSSGVTTANPNVSGQSLTWSGSFVVPAASGATPGTATLHFGVHVSQTPGTYTNSVSAAGSGVTVIAAGRCRPHHGDAADRRQPRRPTPPSPPGRRGPPTTTPRRSPSPRPRRARRSSAASTPRRSPPAPPRSPRPRCQTAPHTFEVRATDPAGNTDPTPASRTFTVDTTPPDTNDHRRPVSGTHQRQHPDLHLHLDRGRLDVPVPRRRRGVRGLHARPSPPPPCRTARTPSRCVPSTVRATSTRRRRAGVHGGHRLPPDTTITPGPGRLHQRQHTDVLLHRDRGGFDVPVPRRRGGVRLMHHAVHRRPRWPTGAHNFEVRATDAAGNTDATPASRAFTVDTDEPGHQHHRGPGGGSAPTTTPRRSRSPRPRRARRSSAASTPRRSQPARRRSRPLLWPTARTPSRCAPPTRRATPTRHPRAGPSRRQSTRPAGHDITAGPSGPPTTTPRRSLHLDRGGLDVPVPRRRAAFAACTSPVHHGRAGRWSAHLRGTGDRRRRQHRPDAGEPGLHGRHHGAGHHDHQRSHRGRPTTTPRPSPSPPPRRARRSSAAWTRGRGRRAPARSPRRRSDGTHTFAVRAIDALGNTDATPATRRSP